MPAAEQEGGISILPIRDGNCGVVLGAPSAAPHFDTSYKGWKQKGVPLYKGELLDFDTSYKGWKRITFGAYTTEPKGISILPIRDGNRKLRLIPLFCKGISILPIRDGNLEPLLLCWPYQNISILPIRDGNTPAVTGVFTCIKNFDTSYKGWKRVVRYFCRYKKPPISILPIRDGNIASRIYSLAAISDFDTSYKGWKLAFLVLRVFCHPYFDTSYKGWKPGAAKAIFKGVQTFRYFL